jgi:hypothetical protein
MQQFIPFEDEWDILDRLSPEDLIPYHVGVPCRHDLAANDHCAVPAAPSASNLSPTLSPTHATMPAGNARE